MSKLHEEQIRVNTRVRERRERTVLLEACQQIIGIIEASRHDYPEEPPSTPVGVELHTLRARIRKLVIPAIDQATGNVRQE